MNEEIQKLIEKYDTSWKLYPSDMLTTTKLECYKEFIQDLKQLKWEDESIRLSASDKTQVATQLEKDSVEKKRKYKIVNKEWEVVARADTYWELSEMKQSMLDSKKFPIGKVKAMVITTCDETNP